MVVVLFVADWWFVSILLLCAFAACVYMLLLEVHHTYRCLSLAGDPQAGRLPARTWSAQQAHAPLSVHRPKYRAREQPLAYEAAATAAVAHRQRVRIPGHQARAVECRGSVPKTNADVRRRL